MWHSGPPSGGGVGAPCVGHGAPSGPPGGGGVGAPGVGCSLPGRGRGAAGVAVMVGVVVMQQFLEMHGTHLEALL